MWQIEFDDECGYLFSCSSDGSVCFFVEGKEGFELMGRANNFDWPVYAICYWKE